MKKVRRVCVASHLHITSNRGRLCKKERYVAMELSMREKSLQRMRLGHGKVFRTYRA